MNYEEILEKLKSMKNLKNVEGMVRYGINSKNNFGVSIYKLRPLAKKIGVNHNLSLKLWESDIHDARLLAIFIDNPSQVSEEQMDNWVKDFDSWDICDQACTSLFDLTPYAYKKVFEWAERDKEFVKRAAFSIIAGIAVHDKKAGDEKFDQFASLIFKHSTDERNYVKKAVNWALRNIGKRNITLYKKMIALSKKILLLNSKSAHWIANDALREFNSEKVKQKLTKKKN